LQNEVVNVAGKLFTVDVTYYYSDNYSQLAFKTVKKDCLTVQCKYLSNLCILEKYVQQCGNLVVTLSL